MGRSDKSKSFDLSAQITWQSNSMTLRTFHMSEFINKIEHILTLLDDFPFSIMGGRPANIFHSGQKLLWPARMGRGGGWSLTWNSNRGHKSFRNTNLCHTWTHIGMSCTTISYLDGVGEAGGHRTTLYHQTIGHKMEKNYLHQSPTVQYHA